MKKSYVEPATGFDNLSRIMAHNSPLTCFTPSKPVALLKLTISVYLTNLLIVWIRVDWFFIKGHLREMKYRQLRSRSELDSLSLFHNNDQRCTNHNLSFSFSFLLLSVSVCLSVCLSLSLSIYIYICISSILTLGWTMFCATAWKDKIGKGEFLKQIVTEPFISSNVTCQ